ncbi:hypothetical protein FSP39_002141 [Pinctada imbricata]|uniref:Uncharacterized protein n=1 Tax=Pinctada imbricata TaxID=66713 RepID=A0AA88XWN1_PINIB|nr:hypothetical protein FSP39_002141 [Pinctada imbricata]
MWKLILPLLPLLCRADPTPCCTGHQFQAALHEIGGYIDPKSGVPTPTDYEAQIYYDYDVKMLRSDRSVRNDDGTVDTTKVIMDYKHVTNSTYTGRQMFGSGKNAVFGDSYRIDLMATKNITMKISVSTDDCTPLYQSVYGAPGGVISEVSYYFTNVQRKLPSDAFNIPPNCHMQG